MHNTELSLIPHIFTTAMQRDKSDTALQEEKSLKNTVFCSDHLLLTRPHG